jgi:phospholipase C
MEPPATYDHVVWIWMENHTHDQVIDNDAAPYTTGLAHACGSATDYRAVGSPSLPNYIAATSGSTQGIRDDGSPTQHPLDADNLFRQVRATGRSARTYAEDMPTPCALASSGTYAVKHNPAAYFTGDGDRDACLVDNVAMGTPTAGALADDLAHDALPAFANLVPNLCNDTHDCGVPAGDAWLHSWLDRILASATYTEGKTAVFVVWDEPTPMPNVVIAPTLSGTTITDTVDHYTLLRTTEELLGLPLLGAANDAPSLRARLRL